jgi:hypothetical protein
MHVNTTHVTAQALMSSMLGTLDGGGMVTCRETGDYVPAEQVIKDPLHIGQLKLFDHDFDCLYCHPSSEDITGGSSGLTDDEPLLPLQEEQSSSLKQDFVSPQAELAFLIAEQKEDMRTCSCGSPKTSRG